MNVCVFVHIHLYSSMTLPPSVLVSLFRPSSECLPHDLFLYLCICDRCTLVFSCPYNLIHSLSQACYHFRYCKHFRYIQLMSWTGERCRVYWKQRREAANGKLMGFGTYKQRLAAITSARLARPPLEMPQRCTAEAEAEAKAAAEVDQTLNTTTKDLLIGYEPPPMFHKRLMGS